MRVMRSRGADRKISDNAPKLEEAPDIDEKNQSAC